jgi:hypothetical protein
MFETDDPNVHRLIDLATGAYALGLENEVKSHPATDTLVAYQEGRLESSQAEEVRRHLVACSLCGEALERLDAYDRESEENQVRGALAASSAARSWASFRERSSIDSARPAAESAGAGVLTTRSPHLAWPSWALAASILFALTGAISLFLTLQPNAQSREARAIGGNPFVFDLLPDGRDAHRSANGIEVVDVPTGMDPIVPRLLLGDQTAYSSYSAILTRVSGETLWKQNVLRRQPSGGFALLILRARLPPGDYVLRLLGEERGVVQELASYTFRVHYLD